MGCRGFEGKAGCEQKHATFCSNPEEFIERLDWACRDTTNLWAFRIWKLVPDQPLAVQQPVPVIPVKLPTVHRNFGLILHSASRSRRSTVAPSSWVSARSSESTVFTSPSRKPRWRRAEKTLACASDAPWVYWLPVGGAIRMAEGQSSVGRLLDEQLAAMGAR